jgi:predicted Zn-dependent protease
VTGSRTFNVFSVEEDVAMGAQAYEQVVGDTPVIESGPEAAMVRRVMDRLVAVADDAGYDWDVQLLDGDETINAFALPGGKMAVYTGILPICESETGLAVVMGHEIGHVVARHGSARMSASLGVEVVLAMINAGDYEELARSAAGLALLPYGRAHESESDHIGLIYMARAGYDPREAVRFWQRMADVTGEGPPEFLSTHPSHETRVRRLQELMPEALEIYGQP